MTVIAHTNYARAMIDACRPSALHQAGSPTSRAPRNTAITSSPACQGSCPLGLFQITGVSALASVAVLPAVTVTNRTGQRPNVPQRGTKPPQIKTHRACKCRLTTARRGSSIVEWFAGCCIQMCASSPTRPGTPAPNRMSPCSTPQRCPKRSHERYPNTALSTPTAVQALDVPKATIVRLTLIAGTPRRKDRFTAAFYQRIPGQQQNHQGPKTLRTQGIIIPVYPRIRRGISPMR